MTSPTSPEYYYSSTAPKMALAAPLTNTGTTLSVDSVAGLPGSRPFKLVLDPGLSGEEIVKVTDLSGTTLTVVRGWDGTAAQSHANLAEVRHMVTAEDLRLAREHEATWHDVHGVNGFVVGTTDQQTLTNKDLSSSTNAFPAELARDIEVTAAVATHAALTKSHGVVGTIVGTSDVQTLTNKTLSGASNTFTAIPKTALTGIAGDIVDLTSTQTLTGKSLDGATNTFTNVPQSAVTGLPAIQTSVTDHETRLDTIEATPRPKSTAAKADKRLHWGTVTVTPNGTGYATITHGAGFDPSVVTATSEQAYMLGVDQDNVTATTFEIRLLTPAGSSPGTPTKVSYICAE